METAKIRMKVGDHEFEAEGSPESVTAQLETFKILLGLVGSKIEKPEDPKPDQLPAPPAVTNGASHVSLERIMRVQGRVVSLTAIPPTYDAASLLILLGNKDLRNNESVTGGEIGDGLAQSGRPVPRVDRVMDKLIEEAFVLKSGFRRAVRYRLSNSGHQKALSIARELVATLP
jgi:hypothetical protein